MNIDEAIAKAKALGLYVGDRVTFTNWIHKRIEIEILRSTFSQGITSNVRVVATGEIATVGRAELVQWLAQPDTEVQRMGTKEEVKI